MQNNGQVRGRKNILQQNKSKVFWKHRSWFFIKLKSILFANIPKNLFKPVLPSKRLFKNFIFPPKNLEKIRVFATRMLRLFNDCFSVTSVWKWLNFPAKRLRKNTGAQNTHAPFFFFSFSTCIQIKSYFLLSSLLFICSIKQILWSFIFSLLSRVIQHTKTTIVFSFKTYLFDSNQFN